MRKMCTLHTTTYSRVALWNSSKQSEKRQSMNFKQHISNIFFNVAFSLYYCALGLYTSSISFFIILNKKMAILKNSPALSCMKCPQRCIYIEKEATENGHEIST
uniref:Uncharacterized protein n=1 Tax=Cacopsylla melanoneura TaxID=428564 RepID=A0A8D8PNK6_9HEMI